MGLVRDPEAFVVALAPEDRVGYARVLRADGWRVWGLARLSQCAERLEWHRPDIVLLDLDGLAESWVGFLTLLGRVRGPAGRVGAVVLATPAGGASREWEIAALELGADCWLRKPYEPRERDLLLALVRRMGRAVRRELLLGEVWGAAVRTPRVVDSYVVLLRRKLARLGPGGPGVETVGGVGYRLVPGKEADEERSLAR